MCVQSDAGFMTCCSMAGESATKSTAGVASGAAVVGVSDSWQGVSGMTSSGRDGGPGVFARDNAYSKVCM